MGGQARREMNGRTGEKGDESEGRVSGEEM
jgi:hypothetical protein